MTNSNKQPFVVIIPARYAASRLPGKPLLDIAGKPMIQHMYERALESGAEEIIIATDDVRIEQVAKQFGAKVCMTRVEHQSGTERIAEVIEKLNFSDSTLIVNIQGDEPLIPVAAIKLVAEQLMANPTALMTTLCSRITDVEEINDPNLVKVVMDQNGFALYFSRSTIPYVANHIAGLNELANKSPYFGHIGVYAYQAGYVKNYVALSPSPLEQLERLEQLRVLWHGGKIHVSMFNEKFPPGINTPKDLENVRNILQN